VFDQSHGLRFDIYERIHLSEELPGIAELEEVELLPEIQVIQREDRAELYGQLLLTGLYRSEDDRTQRLEHAIPVEITVPLTRVSSIEDIGVEIENFDIDLLTMRTVNITGVLSLRGIGGAEPQPQPTWQQEEYTVAYSPLSDDRVEATAEHQEHDNDALYENSQWTFGEDASEVAVEEHEHAEANEQETEESLVSSGAGHSSPIVNFSSAHEKDKGAKARTHSLDSQTEDSKAGISDYWFKAESQNEEAEELQLNQVSQASEVNQEQEAEYTFAREAAVPAANADADQDIAVFTSENEENHELHAQEENENAQPNSENSNEVFVSQETVPQPEEKQDLKIALGSKKEAEAPAKEHLTFSSLLSSSRSRKEQEALQSEGNASAAAVIPEVGNNTEWKSRFITGADGTNLFRKVRLCIVQREETLDTIAEKYQLSARELGMYNRLSGQSVEEGQVLYIP
jgi:stage VI sporulation protein D